MEYIPRLQERRILSALKRNRSVLLLGARQTGKTTLVRRIPCDLFLSFVQAEVRQRYEKEPGILAGEVEALRPREPHARPLVLLDEVQKVPRILDVAQDLIDRQKANFLLTGSSARKLRRGPEINLLPGRVVSLRLDPLTFGELPASSLQERLLYGSLPGMIAVESDSDREMDLESYVTAYLEQEVRAEAIVRNLGFFARFLEYAASESGRIVNLRKLSQEVGVSHTTIASYYQILEDCLIAERVEPLTQSKTRKKLTRSQKYLFFDLGVRRAAAREGTHLPKETMGLLFEQLVGLELIRCCRLSERRAQLRFWRDPDGPEVDWVIEVKWTSSPSSKEIHHLQLFLSEYKQARVGYVICQTPRKVRLSQKILALPWQETDHLLLT